MTRATRVVVQHGCDGGACDLSWRDDTGAEVAAAPGVVGLNGSVVSRDGRLAALFQPRSSGTCTDTLGFTSAYVSGAWRLLDLATGAPLLPQDPAISAEYLDTAFLGGAFVRFFSFDVGSCRPALSEVRRTEAPFAVPAALPALPTGTWVRDELDDGRLLLSLPGEAMGVVLADDPASFFRFTEATGEAASHGAWVHAFERYPVQSLLSVAPLGSRARGVAGGEIEPAGHSLKAPMLTSFALAAALACMPSRPPPPPPPVHFTTRCEGTDRVTRDVEGEELRRAVNACTTLQCEGPDQVRRSFDGQLLARHVNACTVARCEGRDFVVRRYDGLEVSRQGWRCGPAPRPTPARPSDPLRFGLSAR